MILTHCPVCAASLPDLTAKQCSRCKTRYCGPACQEQHWKAGGHDKLCKKIRKGGGAEQYYANTKYAEAVTVAAEACADDTKGQTCYVCTQALHWKTKEGLVRGCSCRGTAGFAHVSCLAEQAKLLNDEGEENNLSPEGRWERWRTCSLCKQDYHGVVACALGWACWKTYVGRPERHLIRNHAMSLLGNGLFITMHFEAALTVQEAEMSMLRRFGASEENMLVMQNNLASTYIALGREDQGLRMRQEVYSGRLKLFGESHDMTLRAANNYAGCLVDLKRFDEAKSLLRKTVPMARRVLGENDELTIKLRWNYAAALVRADGAMLDDLREAVTTLEEIERTGRRVLGGAHPLVGTIVAGLQCARAELAAREGDND